MSNSVHEKIDIRGIPVDNVTLDEAFAAVLSYTKTDDFHMICTPNAEIVQQCIEDREIAALIRRSDLIIPDGAGVVLASKILGTPLKAKTPGCELGERIAKEAGANGLHVYFLGGKPGIAELAEEKLREKYPDFHTVGTHDGYFKKEGPENDAVIAAINEAAPDILFVCLGVPAQEKWIDANRAALGSVKLCLALGGSLDVWAGNVKRAPKLFIKLGLEWFYRLCCEPKRIGRMMKLPKFLFGTYAEKWKGRK